MVASLAIYFVASVFHRSKQIESDVAPAHGAFDAKEWKGADNYQDLSTRNRAPADTASIVAEILQQHRVVIFSKVCLVILCENSFGCCVFLTGSYFFGSWACRRIVDTVAWQRQPLLNTLI